MENNIEKKDLKPQAESIIKNHVLWSIGAGAIPIPIIDMASVTVIQLDMLKQLCKLYHIDYSENNGKSIVSAIAGSTLAKIGASLIKTIPVIGTMMGGLSMAVMSGATTYAMGQVFLKNFEDGKDIYTMDLKTGKTVFNEAFEKGKEYVKDLQKKTKKTKTEEDKS